MFTGPSWLFNLSGSLQSAGTGGLVYDLNDNPFAVLDVTPRTTRQEIHDAVEEATLDADGVQAERKIDLSRQALIAPNERLRAELTYLLEMRPAEARSALRSTSEREWLEVANSTIGVARTNALVQSVVASCSFDDGFKAFRYMFEAWDEVDDSEVTARINESRLLAGIAEATLRDVRRGLSELRKNQAKRTVQHLYADSRFPRLLSGLILETLIPAGKVGEKFPAAVLAAYSTKIGGVLASAGDRAVAELQKFVADATTEAFGNFKQELEQWDELAQPIQLVSEAKGVDDAHSKELYVRVRQSALNLANDKDRHHDALKVTNLAAEIFAELPWSVEAIQKDTEDLNNIILNKGRERILEPLASALNKARNDLSKLSRQLLMHGFTENSPEPVGEIWRGYVGILDPDVELEVRDLGAGMMRSLSIELFNDRSDALQAKMLNSQLLADRDWFSPEVRKRLVEDEDQLAINLHFQHLNEATANEDWLRAKQICGELIEISPASEIAQLRQLERGLDEKLRSRTRGRVIGGGIAAVVLGAIVLNANESSTYEADYNYSSDAALADTVEIPANEMAMEWDTPAVGDVAESLTETAEIAPSAYSYGALSLPQIRYCVRQSERLDLARSLAGDLVQQSRFNSAIDDYNSRCGSFSYDEADMRVAQAEIVGMQPALAADAEAIIGPKSATNQQNQRTRSSEPDQGFYSIDENGNLISGVAESFEPEDPLTVIEGEN